MWNALLRALGFAKKEYHHVVADLLSMGRDLATLAERKKAEADGLAVEIKDKVVAKDAATAVADQATQTATKIAALVGA